MKTRLFLLAMLTSLSSIGQTLLYDQTANVGTGGILCRIHSDPTQAIYNTEGAEDFTVPFGEVWKIDSFVVQGFYNATAPAATPTRVIIYEDSSGTPGSTIVYTANITDGDINNDGTLEPFLSQSPVLEAGTYWLSIGIVTTTVPWYWARIPQLNSASPMNWKNPGGGYAVCTTWEPLYTCIPTVLDSSANFQVYGCLNPPMNATLSQEDTSFCATEFTIPIQVSTTSTNVSYNWNTGATGSSITVDTTGIYTVTVTNNASGGCAVTLDVNIHVLQLPSYDIPDQTKCTQNLPGSFFALAAGASAVWYDGSTVNPITINQPGTYWVTYNGNNGCVGSDTFSLIIDDLNAPVLFPNSPIDLCVGDEVSVQALGTYDQFNWYNYAIDSTTVLSTTSTYTAESGGLYTVVVRNNDGCEATATMTVIDRPLPEPSIVSQYVENGNIKLKTSINYATYAWSTGSTSSNITVTSNGSYAVTVTDDYACEGFKSKLVTTVGVEEAIADRAVIYPNPASSVVSFSVPSNWVNKTTIRIIDTQGRIVESMAVTATKQDLDISSLANGTYIVEYNAPSGIGKSALVISH